MLSNFFLLPYRVNLKITWCKLKYSTFSWILFALGSYLLTNCSVPHYLDLGQPRWLSSLRRSLDHSLMIARNCVLRNWDQISVRDIGGLISRAGRSRYVCYCDKETLNSNKPNYLDLCYTKINKHLTPIWVTTQLIITISCTDLSRHIQGLYCIKTISSTDLSRRIQGLYCIKTISCTDLSRRIQGLYCIKTISSTDLSRRIQGLYCIKTISCTDLSRRIQGLYCIKTISSTDLSRRMQGLYCHALIYTMVHVTIKFKLYETVIMNHAWSFGEPHCLQHIKGKSNCIFNGLDLINCACYIYMP